MACCGAASGEGKEVDKEINAFLKNARNQEKKKVKLLLLGAGESGKSTVFKQMKILYGSAPTDDEKAQYKSIVHSNTLATMKKLLGKAQEFDLLASIANQAALDAVNSAEPSSGLNEQIGNAIKALWADAAIQKVWDRRSEFQVVESMQYFFENIDRLSASSYVGNSEDFVYARVQTTGVVTTSYDIEGVRFEMFDVGGQRNERRKWIHCFSDVTAVIFVAALSEYDQLIAEDSKTNRMEESLHLFEEICAMQYFVKSAIILFMNKFDLFESKIKTKPIKDVPEYADYAGTTIDHAKDYFLKKFLAQNQLADRNIFFHFTTATSTSNIRFVFEACRSIILEQNIHDSGF